MVASSDSRTTVTMASELEVVVTRTFDAPAGLVFEAWTKPEHLREWMGPRGYANVVFEVDLRPGGAYRFVQRDPDGREHAFHGVYREVAPPHRLVSTFVYEGAPEHEALNTLVLREENGKTVAAITTRFQSAAHRDGMLGSGMERGMSQSFARLDDALPRYAGVAELFTFERVVDAPREAVFAAWTELEHLRRWWGPKEATWVSGTLDLRPGGTFHYCMRPPGGGEMWGKFVYRDVVPPERLVFVNAFSDAAGNVVRAPFHAEFPLEILTTAIFRDEGAGRTRVALSGYPLNATDAERKLFVAWRDSMRAGFGATLDHLAEHLATAR